MSADHTDRRLPPDLAVDVGHGAVPLTLVTSTCTLFFICREIGSTPKDLKEQGGLVNYLVSTNGHFVSTKARFL